MMKLLIRNDRVVGTAGKSYRGPMKYTNAPDDFDINQMAQWRFINGALVGPDIMRVVVDRCQEILDATAAMRGYGDARTAPATSIAGYINDKNLRFRTEAVHFQAFRSDMWTKCYEILGMVQLGQLPIPVKFEDVEPLLPTFSWEDVDADIAELLAAE